MIAFPIAFPREPVDSRPPAVLRLEVKRGSAAPRVEGTETCSCVTIHLPPILRRQTVARIKYLFSLRSFWFHRAMINSRHNAIVVGLGVMGSATVCHLAQRGWRVLGLERLTPGHALGSSHGDSRVIREMYFENPLYVPLVQRAHELWRELEERTGTSLMIINGGIMIGPPHGLVVTGTLRSAAEHNLPHEILDPAETRARFPAFPLADGLVAVLDPRAGFLDPEACNRAYLDVARGAGAEIRFNEPALEWMPDGYGVRARAPDTDSSSQARSESCRPNSW